MAGAGSVRDWHRTEQRGGYPPPYPSCSHQQRTPDLSRQGREGETRRGGERRAWHGAQLTVWSDRQSGRRTPGSSRRRAFVPSPPPAVDKGKGSACRGMRGRRGRLRVANGGGAVGGRGGGVRVGRHSGGQPAAGRERARPDGPCTAAGRSPGQVQGGGGWPGRCAAAASPSSPCPPPLRSSHSAAAGSTEGGLGGRAGGGH